MVITNKTTTMKKLHNIFIFAAVVCASAFVSCVKDDNPIENLPKYTKVGMHFTRAASSQEQGDKITDVTVWAYEVSGSGTNFTVGNNGKPVGWGTQTFDTYESTSPQTLYLELPYSINEKTYRFFAIVNKEQFGTIYTPMNNGQQTAITTISSDVTYDELSTYVFENNNLLAQAPTNNAPELMPVSHWHDETIAAETKDDISFDMTVYRALGKASLTAQMSSTSSANAVLNITGVSIGARTADYTVAQQGFMFSDAADVSALTSPSAYGTIADIKRGAVTETTVLNSPMAITTTSTNVCSKFLYENHHADVAQGIIANADAAGDGQYYMKIDYEYGLTGSTLKLATGYVALPAIIRNHEVKVNATFNVSLQGTITLECTVADWEQDDDEQGNANLNFNYPTYSVMSFVRDGNGEVFNDPIVTYDATNPTSFTMLFQMSAPTDGTIKWKPTLTPKAGDPTDFSIEVYEAANVDTTPTLNGNNLYTSSTIEFIASNKWYAIRVKPLEAATATDKVTELRVVYNAPWLGTGVNESMLINGTSGASKWPNSGDDPHYIIVTQKGTNP